MNEKFSSWTKKQTNIKTHAQTNISRIISSVRWSYYYWLTTKYAGFEIDSLLW